MHPSIHPYIHTYILTYLLTYAITYLHTYILKHMLKYMHTYVRTYIHPSIHPYMHTHVLVCVHTATVTCTQSYINAYVHTCLYTYAWKHTDTFLKVEGNKQGNDSPKTVSASRMLSSFLARTAVWSFVRHGTWSWPPLRKTKTTCTNPELLNHPVSFEVSPELWMKDINLKPLI